MDSHAFLQNLAVVLCVAAVATVVFQRLHQPVVFGYLLAGMIIGPHIPIPLVADPQTVRALSELGVILLMFSLGLEFSIRKLVQVSQKAGAVALFECSIMISVGYLVGQMLGFTRMESIFAGAITGISSTTIIVKAFQEQKVKGRVTELVFGILIIEDLIAIFLLTILTTISRSGAVSPTEILLTAMRLAMFLTALIGFGILTVPRAIRAVQKLGQPETTLVASIGICFAAALLALSFGYSVALGAFIAGSLVAESGHEVEIERLVRPVRDMFAAIFFVSVGMMIDPTALTEHWRAVLALTLAVIIGKVLAVTIGAFLAGHGRRTAMKAGMSLAQIGEFSFIIASVGVASGVIRGWLYPGGDRRIRDHDADDSAADQALQSSGGIDRSLAAGADSNRCGAVRFVDRARPQRSASADRAIGDESHHPDHSARCGAHHGGGDRCRRRDRPAQRNSRQHDRACRRSACGSWWC